MSAVLVRDMIDAERKRQGMTLVQLAARTGVTRQTLHKLIKGQGRAKDDTVTWVSEALRMDAKAMLEQYRAEQA